MNIIDIQDQLKNFSEDQLINEMQMPSGNAPQFLVLSEIQRRKRMRDDFAKRQAAQQATVAEEAIAAAGVPQSGIAGMSEAMAPKSTMVQNAVGSAMPESMRSGGLMQFGNDIQKSISSQEVDPFLDEVEDMAESRFGVDFDESPRFGLNIDQRTRPAIGRPFPIFSDMRADLPFESPSRRMPAKGGPVAMPAVIPYEEGGLVDALFSKTDHGKKLSSNQFEVRKGKDGRRMVYKKGTNIFVGTADKVFDEKYDGGLIRAQDGLPRGLRLNNPGNIRPGAGFFGEVGDDGGYAKFASDAAGLRAIQRLLMTYGNQYGINTLRGLANRYAPPSDNNPTENYIEFLSQKTGIDPDEPINLAERGAEIIPAIIGFEQGKQPFSQEMINTAINAAQFDDEDKIADALLPQELIDRGVTASDLTQDDQKAGLMAAMAATSGSSPTPQQDYLESQLSDGPFDAEGRKRRQAPNRVETDPKGSGGRNDPSIRGELDKNRQDLPDGGPAVSMGRNVSRTENSRIDDLKAARTAAIDRAKERAEDAAKKADGQTQTGTDAENKTEADPVLNYTTDTESVSTLEQEIIDLMKSQKADRESDKWLAIAQAGLAIMSSDNPTLLGAIGEGGAAGLKAYREAQDRYNEGVIDLINARAKLAKASDKDLTAANVISRLNTISKMIASGVDQNGMPLKPEKLQQYQMEELTLRRMVGLDKIAV